jgi:hypothetical protein
MIRDFILYNYMSNNNINWKDLTGRPYIPNWRVDQDLWYTAIKVSVIEKIGSFVDEG